LLSKNMV